MIIYLAGPYTHDDPAIEEIRFVKLNRIAAELMKRGYVVFSPISHSHPIAHCMPEVRNDHAFWMKQNLPFLQLADVIYICTIQGYQDSRGIQWEVSQADAFEIPVEYIDENLNLVTQ